MPQLQLPFFPQVTTLVNANLGFVRKSVHAPYVMVATELKILRQKRNGDGGFTSITEDDTQRGGSHELGVEELISRAEAGSPFSVWG